MHDISHIDYHIIDEQIVTSMEQFSTSLPQDQQKLLLNNSIAIISIVGLENISNNS
jgi:hypothetical protein